ncbi:PAAR domain-containing protein [Shinella pollutisoli]|uniref:PAAR domain-containing protein n=1 Tax=Shinella pollutisoli TaxID=2250594 RepID=A0ABV7DJK0_9HYPH|nr:PAAR domain-containing protein [Shinella pollutisoli]
MKRFLHLSGLLAAFGLPPAGAAETAAPIPACALTGAQSVFIGGAPALRLSDVVNCPPELYEIVPSIMIEGQPLVKFRSGAGETGNCVARGDDTVVAEGEAASRLGDVRCTQE